MDHFSAQRFENELEHAQAPHMHVPFFSPLVGWLRGPPATAAANAGGGSAAATTPGSPAARAKPGRSHSSASAGSSSSGGGSNQSSTPPSPSGSAAAQLPLPMQRSRSAQQVHTLDSSAHVPSFPVSQTLHYLFVTAPNASVASPQQSMALHPHRPCAFKL